MGPSVSVAPSPSTPISNLALNRPAALKTTCYGGDASRGVDGNTDGNWGGNSVVHSCRYDDWWKVELQSEECKVTEVIVYARTDCCMYRTNNVKVEVLDSNGEVVATRQIGTATAVNKLEFGGATGKTFKLSGNMMNFAEVEVNGWDVSANNP